MPPVKKIKTKVSKSLEKKLEDTSVISGQLEKQIRKKQKLIESQRGVVLIKHLPHGFFEEQLKKYFQQFGTVTRLRLVRSRRTGGSKGYAFVEFEYPEVAQVAAETMDNYLMFKKVVKALYIPPNQQNFNYFKTSVRKIKNKAGKDIYISSKTSAIQRKVNEHNDWSETVYQKRLKKSLKKIARIQKKYEHLGIDFSNVVVEPKYSDVTEEIQKAETSITSDDKSEYASTANRKMKRKTDPQYVAEAEQKSETEIDLKDLLGSTIVDDSKDEDWIANDLDGGNDVDEDVEEEEEEEGSMEDDNSSLAGNSESDEKETDGDSMCKKDSKDKRFVKKLMKPTNLNGFDKIIKRKPYSGGIQKKVISTKKRINKTTSTVKKSMQVAAVKEFGKNKIQLKSKISKKKKL